MRFWQSETSSQNITVSSDNNFHSHYILKYLGKDIGSSFPLNPNYFIFKQEYLNIYFVEAMPYMPCISLVFFFLGNNCYHSGSMQPLNPPEFLEVCDKAPKCRATGWPDGGDDAQTRSHGSYRSCQTAPLLSPALCLISSPLPVSLCVSCSTQPVSRWMSPPSPPRALH